MTVSARKRGCCLQIWISAAESAEWDTDEELRKDLLKGAAVCARAKGRRHYEIFSILTGATLASGAA